MLKCISISRNTASVLGLDELWETFWLTNRLVSSNCNHQLPYSKISKKYVKCLLKESSIVLTPWALSVRAFEVEFPGGCSVCFCVCVSFKNPLLEHLVRPYYLREDWWMSGRAHGCWLAGRVTFTRWGQTLRWLFDGIDTKTPLRLFRVCLIGRCWGHGGPLTFYFQPFIYCHNITKQPHPR